MSTQLLSVVRNIFLYIFPSLMFFIPLVAGGKFPLSNENSMAYRIIFILLFVIMVFVGLLISYKIKTRAPR